MKLYICFLWHMHQPYYKDPETGSYILPWVRLHAVKDYVALPRIFREYPAVRHTFNLVPSLLIQVRDYVENGAEDVFLSLSRKNALDLTREEERFLLRNFFSAFAPTMILPYPRYADLFRRHESALRAVGRQGAPGGFGASDYADLMTLFNLAWFHPLHVEEDPELSRLRRKESGYTEREKAYVLDRQIEILASVIPEYRKFQEADGGELSSTPMYHPILPLVIDNRAAQAALPGAPLPQIPFAHPNDAVEQLRRGRKEFHALFGRNPVGLWPSEGSISPAAVEMAAREGFRWAATDEMLLSKALGKTVFRDADGVPADPDWLYHPYQASTAGGQVDLFFRDHHLSDLIGFEYSRWDAVDAANNFIHKISRIYDKLSSLPSRGRQDSYVVPVILDGENAWEYYFDSGRVFLRTLLARLSALSPGVRCVTFSEALDLLNYKVPLPTIPTGSWIDGTFNIWIGHAEDRTAWEMLAKARDLWEVRRDDSRKAGMAPPPEIGEAYEHLLVAEGSDWCWWYGDDHFTPHGPEFDRLFRHQVKAAYRKLGVTPPDSLDIPIIRTDRMPVAKNRLPSPLSYIHPKIDGVLSSYFEWSGATRYLPSPEFGAMHRAGHGMLSCLHYGFGREKLFFRVDLHPSVFESQAPLEVELLFTRKNLKVGAILSMADKTIITSFGTIDEGLRSPKPVPEAEAARAASERDAGETMHGVSAGFAKVLELAIPFEVLACANDAQIEFFLTIRHRGSIGERWPMFGDFIADLPGKDFEERMWDV